MGPRPADFAKDAAAAVEFLSTHERIDSKQIGLAGHSEGGLIAPIVCGLREDIAFVVLMAGTGVDGATIITSQTEAMLRVEMTEPEELGELEIGIQLNKLLVAQAVKGEIDFNDPDFSAKVDRILEALSEDEIKTAKQGLKSAKSDWRANGCSSFLKHDPREFLSKIECPILAINGSKDLQVCQI